MAKEVKEAEVVEEKSTPTPEETIEILITQVKDYADKAEHFKTMLIKAQGALEVLYQMHPELVKKQGDS
tara:strand:+ start:592 stop:798 length:207 start_codon:yes stop_codon:yes gene_type:complete